MDFLYHFLEEEFLNLIDDLFKRIPFLRTVYSAIVQMTETFSKKDDGKKSVVLIEYPRKRSLGGWFCYERKQRGNGSKNWQRFN